MTDAGSGRVVVLMPAEDEDSEWVLPPAEPVETPWIMGGVRTLHELAIGIAATGRPVELRGRVWTRVLDELEEATGVRPELPAEGRVATPEDTLVISEGLARASIYERVAATPGRRVLVLLGPPGLVGWSFEPGWSRPDPLTVEISSLATPGQFRAIAALGYELWSNTPRLRDSAEAAGVRCHLIGHGHPEPFPAIGRKDIDVAWMTDNRWTTLSAQVAAELETRGIECVSIPSSSHADVLAAFGRARILIHPSRIEGRSRIGSEARAMGAVPVVLESNVYARGFDESGGAVPVASVDAMADAVAALLADPERLATLAARGVETARAEAEWEPFVRRLDAGLDSGGSVGLTASGNDQSPCRD